jgi:hypothetical protein
VNGLRLWSKEVTAVKFNWLEWIASLVEGGDCRQVQLAAVLNGLRRWMTPVGCCIERIVSQCYLVDDETSSVEYRDNEARESYSKETALFYLGMHELYYRTDSKKWTIEGGEVNYRRRRLPKFSCWLEMRLRQKSRVQRNLGFVAQDRARFRHSHLIAPGSAIAAQDRESRCRQPLHFDCTR